MPDSPRQRGSYGRRPRRSKARFAANGRRGGCAQPTDAGRGRGKPFQAGMLWMLWLDPHGHTREHPAAGGGTNGQTGDQADRQDRHRCGRRRSTRASARARSGAAGGDDSTFQCGLRMSLPLVIVTIEVPTEWGLTCRRDRRTGPPSGECRLDAWCSVLTVNQLV